MRPPDTVVESHTGAPVVKADVSIPDITPITITCPKALFAISSITIITEGMVEEELA